MQRRQFISGVLSNAIVGAGVCGLSGCGTFMYEERRGTPHSDSIDWKVAALDGLGLLLFFIPGVAAFAVDFYTGAIYLPVPQTYPGYGVTPLPPVAIVPHDSRLQAEQNLGTVGSVTVAASEQKNAGSQNPELKRIALPREQMQPQQLRQVVADHFGQEISLDDTQVRVSKLSNIDQFDEQLTRHRSDRSFGQTLRSLFS